MKHRKLPDGLLGIGIEPTYFDMEHHVVDAAEIVGIAGQFKANAVRVGMFSHQGHAYYPSRIAPEAPFLNSRNLLQEFENECRKQGILFVVYLNSKYVTDLYHAHRDWAVRIGNKPMAREDKGAALQIYAMCPKSPFMRYFRSIVREVVTMSRPDAVYIDNFGLPCYCTCRYCRKSFGHEIPDRNDITSLLTRNYLKWRTRESRRIAASIVSAARSRDLKMPVVFNRGDFWNSTPEDIAVYADVIADGVHAESAVRFKNECFEHINEQCTFGRSIGRAIWTWVEYPMLPHSYAAPSPAETMVKAAKVVANGGRPLVWSVPCAPLVDLKGMSGVKHVFDLVSKYSSLFDGIRFDSSVGIMFSSRNLNAICHNDCNRLDEYRRARDLKSEFHGAHELLIRNHITHDFVLDEEIEQEKLQKYRLILLPSVGYLSRRQCDRLRMYVRNGGAVFATYETSLFKKNGDRLSDFALADLFGAEYVKELGEQSVGQSVGYARFGVDCDGKDLGIGENLFPVGGRYLAVRSCHARGRLLKRCRYYCDYPQEETCFPAVIARQYGAGKVIYVPGQFFKFYHERQLLQHGQFFRQCVEWILGGSMPVITDLPDTVELTVTGDKSGRRILHLVNCSFDKTRPVDEIIPVVNRYVKVFADKNYRQATDITAQRTLRVIVEKTGYCKVRLGPLTGYNVIVLE